MPTEEISLEIVDVLRRRNEIVACLLDEPRDKRTLDEELDIARSTLDRAIRELEALDLVTYSEGEYAVTSVGERLARNFFAFRERAELALEFEPFLRWMPDEDFDFDLRVLADAEVLVPEPENPYAMIDRHIQCLRQMEEGRMMLPFVGLHGHETAHERIVENGATVELIVESDVAEIMFSEPAFGELTEEMIATGRLDLYISEEPIPYFVGVFDDETVQIGVDEDGEPRALVETDREDVRAWANNIVVTYKNQATTYPQAAIQASQSEMPPEYPISIENDRRWFCLY